MDPIEEFYIVNLKYAVDALRQISDLDPQNWRQGPRIAKSALGDMAVKLLDKVGAALEEDQKALEGHK